MKKFFVYAFVAVATIAMAMPALAVPPGKTIEFEKGPGKVVFSGKNHADAGNKCADCHSSGLFKMKKGADAITMAAINEGKFCGHCHNGTKAFDAKDAKNCSKCHQK